jgi:hypothetical protein
MLSRWDYFVLRHQSPGNWLVHLASAVLFYVFPVLALVFRQPWFLAGFFASGAVGAFGHWYFKDATVSLREATVAVEVPHYVLVMFYKIARGTYAAEILRARARAHELGATSTADLVRLLAAASDA